MRPAYLGVLLSLWREDGLNTVERGRRAGLEPSTMTGLLDRREKDGLRARAADPADPADAADRRAQRIVLTELGRGVRRPVLTAVDRTLRRVLRGVPAPEVERVKNTMLRILAHTDRPGVSHDAEGSQGTDRVRLRVHAEDR